MDRPKDIVKSKSSNGAITTKSESRKNKKSLSNAELQPLLQKRSVYLEKVSTNSQVPIQQKQPKTPIIPRPGKKRFLASVLNILSKSTAATQFPETEAIDNRRCEKVKYKCRKKAGDVPTLTEITVQPSSIKQPKFRSKILNELMSDSEQFVVLQSKKDIVNTPSISSSCTREPEVVRWSDFLPPLVKRTDSTQDMEKGSHNATDGIAKEIYEGLQMKSKKDLRTYISDDIPQRNEKGLYNFFVDLLETTFSVYNVKTGNAIPSHNSSKINLEMDEAVAQKLRISNSDEIFEVFEDVPRKPRSCSCAPKNNVFCLTEDCPKTVKSKSTTPKWDSTGKTLPKTRSDNTTTRSKNPRKELLNILKTELSVDIANFEEPTNIYEALKLMAQNKRKCQKSIHFTRTSKLTSDGGDDPECVFKRRKVISLRSKSPKKSKYRPESEVIRSIRRFNDSTRRRRKESLDNDSAHSIEVTGYDYEANPVRALNQVKEIVLTYHSTPNQSEKDFHPNDALITCSPSGTSTYKNSFE